MKISGDRAKSSPTILCIETSSLTCGVALVRGAHICSEFSHWLPNVHDKCLAGMTESILTTNSLRASELDAVAVSAGPGSFTGLRIGVAFAKALCFEGSPKLIAVPTLSSAAFAAKAIATLGNFRGIMAAVTSQAGKFYVQEFDLLAQPTSEARLCESDAIRQGILARLFLCGNAAQHFPEACTTAQFSRIQVSSVAAVAIELFNESSFSDVDSFVPIYTQDFVPQMRLKKGEDAGAMS